MPSLAKASDPLGRVSVDATRLDRVEFADACLGRVRHLPRSGRRRSRIPDGDAVLRRHPMLHQL